MIRPYVESLLQVLLQRLKDGNPRVAMYVLRAIGALAQVHIYESKIQFAFHHFDFFFKLLFFDIRYWLGLISAAGGPGGHAVSHGPADAANHEDAAGPGQHQQARGRSPYPRPPRREHRIRRRALRSGTYRLREPVPTYLPMCLFLFVYLHHYLLFVSASDDGSTRRCWT